jgi:hypothetical protein
MTMLLIMTQVVIAGSIGSEVDRRRAQEPDLSRMGAPETLCMQQITSTSSALYIIPEFDAENGMLVRTFTVRVDTESMQ